MPTTRPRPNETREMRLFSRVIKQHWMATDNSEVVVFGDRSLPQFLARRRRPGESHRSWDEIRYELADISGEIVTDGTIRKWAKRYGIPEDTVAEPTDEALAAYSEALRAANIDL